MKRLLPVAVALLACGCGYIGDPLPPLLNIPERAGEPNVIQRGAFIVVDVSVPRLSTEGVVLKPPPHLDLRAGPAKDPFHEEEWAAQAKRPSPVSTAGGVVRYELPVAGWENREIVFGARAVGANGRDAGWSKFVVLQVAPPPPPPAGLRAEGVPEGVRLTWQGAGRFRLYRRGPDDKEPAAAAVVEGNTWLDTATEYGKTYEYALQALVKAGEREAESERSQPVRIVPQDRFAPAPPKGLTAVVSAGSVELLWDRNEEPDLAGYVVYRSVREEPWTRLAERVAEPAFSDRKIEAGARYKYAVAAVDRNGNESGKSAAVEAQP